MKRYLVAGAAALAILGGSTAAAIVSTSPPSVPAAATSSSRTTAEPASSTTAGSPAVQAATTPPTSASLGVTNWAAEGLTLGHDVLPGLSAAASSGTPAGSTMLTVAVGLAQPDPTDEEQLIAEEYNPSSPLYHVFLSPAVFDKEFGVPPATVHSTEAWLQSGGLRIGYVSPAGDLVQARGSVSEISALMKTSFGSYRVGDIGFIADRTAPEIPKALPITVVSGLNTLQRVWTGGNADRANGQEISTTAPGANSRTAKTASGNSYIGTLLPQDLWGVYDAPSADTGQGERAGMFGSGYVNGVISVLRTYEARTGLPQVPVRQVLQSDFSPNSTPNDGDVYDDVEWDLDNEAISSMAPGLSELDQYFASTPADPDMAVMFNDWANDPFGPNQMDASFGECEAVPEVPSAVDGALDTANYGEGLVGEDFEILADPSLEQAVAEGRTLFAASGDTGGSCPVAVLPVIGAGNGVNPQPAPNDQNYPCVSIYAVCVGGTVVTTDGSQNAKLAGAPSSDQLPAGTPTERVDEQSWAFTGGGPAAFTPEPSWQEGVAGIDEPCTSPLSESGSLIVPGTVCRGVPDVAALSGDGITDGTIVGSNGYYLSLDDMPLSSGGTSLSSPLTVGMWSRIQAAAPEDEQCVAADALDACTAYAPAHDLGFADETFYRVGAGQIGDRAQDFYDVTTGDLPIGNFYQRPGPGWDYTSGWGAIDIAHFIADVDGDSSEAPTHAPASPVSAAPPGSVNCSVSVTSPRGNAYDFLLTPPVGAVTNDPALDITWASMTELPDGNTLQVIIGGPGLSTTGPPDAIDGYNFYATWYYKGTTYTAFASVNNPSQLPATPATNSMTSPVSAPTGQVTYGDGTLTGSAPSSVHIDKGSFTQTGTAGYFTIDVPLDNVGDPGPGAALQYPFVWDNLPNGVLEATATDEAVAPPPGEQLILGSDCPPPS
jgi:pseudomonalisin